jgi:hypothetical protein
VVTAGSSSSGVARPPARGAWPSVLRHTDPPQRARNKAAKGDGLEIC